MIEKFKNIIGFFRNLTLNQDQINFKLLGACQEGDLEKVKYWLTSPHLIKKAEIQWRNNLPLEMTYYENGAKNPDLVKYILSSPELKEHAGIHADNDRLFLLACSRNDQDMIKFLLTSPLLKKHVDIHTSCGKCRDDFTKDKDFTFKRAYEHNNLEVMKYLLTSTDLKEHINLNEHTDKLFKTIYKSKAQNKVEIMEFLILEVQLEKTPFIQDYLKNNKPNKQNNFSDLAETIDKMFKKRELKNKLEKKLPTNELEKEKVNLRKKL